MSQFIGRAEPEVKKILESILYTEKIDEQVPIEKIINYSDYDHLGEEGKKHKFDFVVHRGSDVLVVEVNYKHGSKAARKWIDLFVPYIETSKVFSPKIAIPVAINDWDCNSLFKHDRKRGKPIKLTDIIDVCNALITSGVKLCQ